MKAIPVPAAPRPTNVTELKAYLGLLTYCGRFMKGLSTVLGPLHLLFRKTASGDGKNGREVRFRGPRTSYHRRPLVMSCGASKYGIGAVLSHVMEDEAEKSVAFASRSLKKATVNNW